MKFSKTDLNHGVWPCFVRAEQELEYATRFFKERSDGLGYDPLEKCRKDLDNARAAAEASRIARCPEFIDAPHGHHSINTPTRFQCMFHIGHKLKDLHSGILLHRNGGVSWERGATFNSSLPIKPISTKAIGDALENELLERLLLVYPKMVKTNVNAIGVDLQYSPDVDVQSKAHHGVGPQQVSHFADSSEAILKIMVGLTFTKEAKVRALKRNVTLLTLKDFRKRYPLSNEEAR